MSEAAGKMALSTKLYATIRAKKKEEPSALDQLLHRGVPKHQAYKALAATGWSSVKSAEDWLREHSRDPSLEDPIPQEYILYLIPSGPLGTCLQEFWKESLRVCGKNKAHSSFPHITLCQFFTCEDQKVEGLYKALRTAGDKSSFPKTISLSLYSSGSFIGFFLSRDQACAIRSFVEEFCSLASTYADCSVRLVSRDFHLTLAHKFSPHHQGTLECLAKSISPTQSCVWEATIYSRDMRFVHYQTLRALFSFSPQHDDELEVRRDDCVFVDPTRANDCPDGWGVATSHRTGQRGLVPKNYMERTPDTSTWVRHRCYTFLPGPEDHRPITEPPITEVTTNPRILLLCPAESVERVFGPRWLTDRALKRGVYTRDDLNLPAKLPDRKEVLDFARDPPLSSCGMFQARLFGEALRESPPKCSAIFSSPALSCVQTAQQILEGMTLQRGEVKICVDGRLSDGTENPPNFMGEEELERSGYKVDREYRPSSPPEGPQTPEDSLVRFLQSVRLHLGGRESSGGAEKNRGLTVIIGPTSALLPLSHIILGVPAQPRKGSTGRTMEVPPLTSCLCEEVEDGRWVMMESALKSLTHSSSYPIRWNDLFY